MDTRKVQITGKSTYVLTLPKKWAVSSKLAAGSHISIFYQDDGSLLLKPPGTTSSKKTKKLKFKKELDHLKRDIVGLYIVGDYQSIEVVSDSISSEEHSVIKDLCHRLVGFEIVESNDRKIVIKNFLDTEDFTIEKGLKRMSSLIYLMLDELASAFEEDDRDMCQHIITRDDDLDRMFLLVSKQHVDRLNLKKRSKNDRLSLVESFYYRLAASDVERIGDHISKISLHFSYLSLPMDARSVLVDLCRDCQKLFMDSSEALRGSDRELANDVLGRGDVFNEKLINASQVPVGDSIELIIDSFSRIRDYASNIAESAIDLSQL
ncbi:phosphate signaling complex PhoU family protein [Methanolobus profundi]|uniref:Phosphate uptake regulator n=1 Tax=Methanolobus profundi TaxID=487685 RepID=A0A1I4PCK5_9EURY|nr:phosphate uptake regulator PhoU [Methanolobus profundi]SFM25387.1 Phosphate uptake regulator [Methanolobus profundi]